MLDMKREKDEEIKIVRLNKATPYPCRSKIIRYVVFIALSI